jgi:hypothetical protein
VLSQVFRYINAYSSFPSTGMNYVMTYYRPENHFPNRVLGGFSRSLAKPRLCSVDSFAYLHLSFNEQKQKTDRQFEWELKPASPKDLSALETFYDGISGGLTVKAFGLEASDDQSEAIDLNKEFEKAGLRRNKSVYSLFIGDCLKSVIMVLDSDTGLNLSNLMKCMHVFVIDKDGMSLNQLTTYLSHLSFLYEEQEIPILIYPASYVNENEFKPEKVYDLLVFDASIVDEFIHFVERLTNRALRKKYHVDNTGQQGVAIANQ